MRLSGDRDGELGLCLCKEGQRNLPDNVVQYRSEGLVFLQSLISTSA